MDTVTFYKKRFLVGRCKLTFAVSNFGQMKKKKKQIKKIKTSSFHYLFNFYHIITEHVFSQNCAVVFFIKIALKISVFALAYFNNIDV